MIIVNDREIPFREGLTVHQLLYEMDPRMPIAMVKIGGRHFPRAQWETRTIQDGEELRVVYIIAGG